MEDERCELSYEDAEEMLPDGENIHTFRDRGFPHTLCLIGADWSRKKILAAIKGRGVELSGEMATNMNHGLVLFDDIGPLFIETRKADA